MDNQKQEEEIQKRVLAQRQDDLLYAFFRAFHGDDEEGVKKAIDELHKLDQEYGTRKLAKLYRFIDKVNWIQQQPNPELAAQIVSIIDKKAFFDEQNKKS